METTTFQTSGYSLFSSYGRNDYRSPDSKLDYLIRQYHELMCSAVFTSGAKYKLAAPIGKGRQGVVYRAQRKGERDCVTQHAIKLYDPANYLDSNAYWLDMSHIASQVADMHRNRCPNLVDTDFYTEIDGVGMVQMELIDGINLGQLLSLYYKLRQSTGHQTAGLKNLFNQFEGRFCVQPGVVAYIMRQMLAGLENLHSASYLHCDIKPSNIMVDCHGYIRLIDLGRATRLSDGWKRALATPAYASPEYHCNGNISIQSDLYSVGLVGLELLRGQALISRSKALSRPELHSLKCQLVDNLERLLPPYVSCNRELLNILKRFLEPDPDLRFPSALSAESSSEGLAEVHRQLTRMDIDSDYRRDLAAFVKMISKVRPFKI